MNSTNYSSSKTTGMQFKKLLLHFSIGITIFFSHTSLVAQPTAGLMALFKFNGNTVNQVSGGITATTTGTSYTANNAGVPNSALQFAGSTSSYANIIDGGGLDFTGDFSVTFGIYMSSTAASQGFYDNGLNYGGIGIWYFSSDNTLRFNFKNGSIGAPAALPLNQWKAVSAVRSGSTLRLYVDGVQVATGTEGTSAITYPNAPVLGQMYATSVGGNYNPAATGTKMDELRFYNRALSAAEVFSLVGFTLPLNLGNFTAVKQASGIKLNWETLSEQNTSHFEIERSTDGVNFISVGSINAKGNTTDKQFYTYTDVQAMAGTIFYRLKQTDTDNSYTYSRVIMIKNDSSIITFQLSPNPARDALQVQLSSLQKEIVKVMIIDAAGKSVYYGSIQLLEGNNSVSIPVQHLAQGIYHLIIDRKESRQTKIFVKQ